MALALNMAYQPEILVETAELGENEWLRYRELGIGGSDAAVVLAYLPAQKAKNRLITGGLSAFSYFTCMAKPN